MNLTEYFDSIPANEPFISETGERFMVVNLFQDHDTTTGYVMWFRKPCPIVYNDEKDIVRISTYGRVSVHRIEEVILETIDDHVLPFGTILQCGDEKKFSIVKRHDAKSGMDELLWLDIDTMICYPNNARFYLDNDGVTETQLSQFADRYGFDFHEVNIVGNLKLKG